MDRKLCQGADTGGCAGHASPMDNQDEGKE